MDEKRRNDCKLEEIRRENLIQEEIKMSQIEKSRKRLGSQNQVDQLLDRVQNDINTRKVKAERKRQQKSISEENELKSMFKPKTNKRISQHVNFGNNVHTYQQSNIKDQNDPITFEQNEPFNKHEFEFVSPHYVHSNESKFEKSAKKLNKKLPSQRFLSKNSSNLKTDNSKSSKTLNQGTECATSFTTTYETNIRGRNKKFEKQNSSNKTGYKSPKSSIGNANTHKAWSDYINNIRNMIDVNDLPVKYLDKDFEANQ